MKKIILLLSASVSLSTADAQQWQIIDSIPDNAYGSSGLHFWNVKDGIALRRSNAMIVKTKDGGHNWDTLFMKQQTWLEEMKFISNSVGFAGGGSLFSPTFNLLLSTYDSGATWNIIQENMPGLFGIQGIDFFQQDNEIQGVVYNSNTIFRTVDSGKTLTQIPTPATVGIVGKAVMAGYNTIVCTTDKGIFSTTDWGVNWTLVYKDPIVLSDMHFFNGVGVAAADKAIIISTDRGKTWQSKPVPNSDSVTFNKIKIERNGDIYILGNKRLQGYVFGSNDRGEQWTRAEVDYDYMIFRDISMPARDTGYIISTNRLHATTTGGGLRLTIGDKVVKADDITIYPNPAKDELLIKAGGKLKSVVVYDMSGRQVMNVVGDCTHLDVHGFPAGNYVVVVSTYKETLQQKITISK